jgi:polar amino acid transport system substrate-binding protein
MLRSRALAVVAATTALALTACGSDSLSQGSDSSSTSAVPTSGPDEALVGQLPESISSAGKIIVGTDASYAPSEFLDADGQTVKGFDVDLFEAVAAKFGVTVEWQPAKFDSIIAGVQGGKYDVGVSSFTINDARKEQVNMVSYFNAGTQWAAAQGDPKSVDPENPCGLNVAVQQGTVQQEEDLPPKVSACEDEGNPINVLVYEGQDEATAAVATGKADAMLADSPVVAYAVQQSDGELEAVGDIYDAAPYGYVIPKDQTDFAQAIADALTSLDSSGDYTTILSNWGVQDGAITDFAVNP